MRVFAVLALALAACTAAPGNLTADESSSPIAAKPGSGLAAGAPQGSARWRGTPVINGRSGAALAAPGHLSWHGGQIVANARVYNFYFGNAFAAGEASERARYDAFLSAIDGSWDFVQPLNQYGIAPVRFLGSSVYPADPGPSLSDEVLRATLSWAILNGYAPWPDAATVYQVFLPQGTNLTHGQEQMCQSFCGYHGSYDDARINSGQSIRYVALPRPDCNGCVYAALVPDRETVISSHELSELVTDPDVNNHRLGWYDDRNNQEIGDLCASAPKGAVQGFPVQAEWSNAAGACVAPHDPQPDFTLRIAPRALSLARGHSTTAAVTTAAVAGYSGTPALEVQAPVGLSASLSGGVLSLSADDGLDAGAYTVTVTARDGALSHSEAVAVQVTVPRNAVVFSDGAEQGAAGWAFSGGFFVEHTASARTGTARFRSNAASSYAPDTSAWMTSPAFDLTGFSTVTLTYAWKAQTEAGWDFFAVYATSDDGQSWTQLQSFSGESPGFPSWAPLAALDLSAFAGEPRVRLAFGVTSDGSVNGWGAAVDDIEVQAQ